MGGPIYFVLINILQENNNRYLQQQLQPYFKAATFISLNQVCYYVFK